MASYGIPNMEVIWHTEHQINQSIDQILLSTLKQRQQYRIPNMSVIYLKADGMLDA